MDASKGPDLDVSVKQLIDGFDALYEEVQLLSLRRTQLEQKLGKARKAYQEFFYRCRWSLDGDDEPSIHEFLKDDQDHQSTISNKPLNLQDLARPTPALAEQTYNVINSAAEARDRIAVSNGWPMRKMTVHNGLHTSVHALNDLNIDFVKELDSGSGSPSLGVQSSPRMYTCRRCDETYSSKKLLHKHLRATKHNLSLSAEASAKSSEVGTGRMPSPLKCPVSGTRLNADPPAGKPDKATASGTERPQCPFAAMQKQMSTAHASPNGTKAQPPPLPRSDEATSVVDTKDPIAVEALNHEHASQTHSAAGSASASRCPIRFLNQHSPEEVAQYFETHKHELPRSHEICVRRYQSNEQSIRELDAKYGNLVTMIQGLGMKHQPLLPTSPAIEPDHEQSKSDTKVQNWAKTVASSLDNGAQPEGDVAEFQEEHRESHFDRPLKEVRVGESPSRPWGIHVPPAPSSISSVASHSSEKHSGAEKSTVSSKHSATDPTSLPHANSSRPDNRPRTDAMNGSDAPQAKSSHKPRRASMRRHPRKGSHSLPKHMLFTGPVFIGYSEEQAMRILQQSKSNASGHVLP